MNDSSTSSIHTIKEKTFAKLKLKPSYVENTGKVFIFTKERLKMFTFTFIIKKGTTARDHLSSERTWLTYIQTSLSIASVGVGKSNFKSNNYK